MLGKKSTKDIVRSGASGGPEAVGRESGKKPDRKKKEPDPGREARERPAILDIVKSKPFLGGVCILLGLLVAFVAVPLLQARTARTVPVVVLSQAVPAGAQITGEMLSIQERGMVNLPGGVLSEKEEAAGMYLAVAGMPGDILTAGRLVDEVPSDDPELVRLPAGKLAMSAALESLEQSVSGKLRAGDIIQIFSVREDSADVGGYVSAAVPELQRVEVLSVTNSGAQDIVTGDQTADMDRQLATVVLAVNAEQAAVLAGLDHTATLHAALVTRGDAAAKQAALQQQEDYFIELKEKQAALEQEQAAGGETADGQEADTAGPGEDGAEGGAG